MSFNYKIDFKRLVVLILPTFLRKKRQLTWLFSLVSPMEMLYIDFMAFADVARYKLHHNGQVVHLQKALNDAFDLTQREIFIEDKATKDPLYIYHPSEEKPVYVGSHWVYSKDETDDLQSGVFIVKLPNRLRLNDDLHQNNLEKRIKHLIDYYKLASKTYEIQWIN